MNEYVVLVDINDNAIGTMEKIEAHEKALLHRAFSVFIFNEKGQMLLQQRAYTKYHSGGLWTNACCSHPRSNENIEAAATRRLQEEMGFTTPLQKAFTFTYKANFDNGLVEHEYDHVLIGQYNNTIAFNTEEVAAYKYESLQQIEENIALNPSVFTAWFIIAFPKVKQWLQQQAAA
jgi:isopentenyl-diphosphate Delta-isomerase